MLINFQLTHSTRNLTTFRHLSIRSRPLLRPDPLEGGLEGGGEGLGAVLDHAVLAVAPLGGHQHDEERVTRDHAQLAVFRPVKL